MSGWLMRSLSPVRSRDGGVVKRGHGDKGVPRTVIGGVVVEGVDEERIKQLCRKA